MTERLCVNCKHYGEPERRSSKGMVCNAMSGKQHPVTGGSMTTIEAGLMRLTLCGFADPKFWEPKS